MAYYLLRRGAVSLALLWAALSITFLLMKASPGDPADRYLSPEIPPATLALIRTNFGFDEPLHRQYLKWLSQFAQGNFGISLSQHRPVSAILFETLPATLQLTGASLIVSFLAGVFFGAFSALHAGRWLDRVLSSSMLVCYSMPSFWVAMMLVLIFAIHLHWLPVSHVSSLFAPSSGGWSALWDRGWHLVLPVLALALGSSAGVARLVRENLITILESDFIRLGRAKGLSKTQILFRHALRHALLPVISLFGLSFPFLFCGAFLIESIFAWPGMGRVMVEAIFSRDYPVVLAANALSAAMIIAGNLVSDILYRLADPRIR